MRAVERSLAEVDRAKAVSASSNPPASNASASWAISAPARWISSLNFTAKSALPCPIANDQARHHRDAGMVTSLLKDMFDRARYRFRSVDDPTSTLRETGVEASHV